MLEQSGKPKMWKKNLQTGIAKIAGLSGKEPHIKKKGERLQIIHQQV